MAARLQEDRRDVSLRLGRQVRQGPGGAGARHGLQSLLPHPRHAVTRNQDRTPQKGLWIKTRWSSRPDSLRPSPHVSPPSAAMHPEKGGGTAGEPCLPRASRINVFPKAPLSSEADSE